MNDPYLTKVTRAKLTLRDMFNEIREEIFSAVDDLIPIYEHSTWECLG
jgi:hypothetical protein